MTDLEKAARMALEALEAHADIGIKADKAITALRQALEQPAQQHVSVMTVLHLKDRTEIGYGPASAGYDLPTGEYRLYTSPQRKPWVGLTDEELEIINDCGDTDSYKFARAIEAKLKEKNA